jgi:hypothetical protein
MQAAPNQAVQHSNYQFEQAKDLTISDKKKIQEKQESKHETQTIVCKLGEKLLRWLVRITDFESRTIWDKR